MIFTKKEADEVIARLGAKKEMTMAETNEYFSAVEYYEYKKECKRENAEYMESR